MKKLTIGILAHVDAGKTTCVESLLYQSGEIRKLGRVDNRDTVLDYDEEERNYGITIYAKEAYFTYGDTEVYIIDTPGHIDFSSEMERSLQVLDFAIMIINGQDGVQAHTETIYQCLQHYHIPFFIFVNKMDISHMSHQQLFTDIQKFIQIECVNWLDDNLQEKLAMVNEDLLNEYMADGEMKKQTIVDAFYRREFVPVLFGSALKMEHTEDILKLVDYLSRDIVYPDEFGAKVYKISNDENGNRLTHMKITGGTLLAKQKINDDEKIDQIRRYHGLKFDLMNEAHAGDVVLVKGLHTIESGNGLGFESDSQEQLLQAYMTYQLVLPKGANALVLSDTMKQLASEDPTLEIEVDEKTKQITIQTMGRMQLDILQKKIEKLSGILVGFSTGSIVYQETIAEPVFGAGHFEPLRHYAEVHVRLDPLPRGSGIIVKSEVSTDVLSSTWQRSILSSLQRKRHRGVLTGFPITDVEITLIAGRGSNKHTSGGDFRQAACRAVRQALMKADNIVLEPYYQFTISLPSASLSHALYDLEQRHANVVVEESDDGKMRISGSGPVRTLFNYQDELITYTGGSGRFQCQLKGYEESTRQSEIQDEIGYDPESDVYNTADSVFCKNGAGFHVPWSQSDAYMHIQIDDDTANSPSYQRIKYRVNDEDLDYIAKLTSGKNRNLEKEQAKEHVKKMEKRYRTYPQNNLEPLLIVDGYNMIFAWEHLKQISQEDIGAARDELVRCLYNYLPYYGHEIIVVFDAYKVQNNSGSSTKKGKLTVVFTKSQETADAWLERSSYDLKGKYQVTYATSDGLIQNAVFSQGALRMSAKELESVLRMHHVILQ